MSESHVMGSVVHLSWVTPFGGKGGGKAVGDVGRQRRKRKGGK